MSNVLKPGSTRPVGPVGPGPGGETGLTPDSCSDQPGRVLQTRRSNLSQKPDQPGNPTKTKTGSHLQIAWPEI